MQNTVFALNLLNAAVIQELQTLLEVSCTSVKELDLEGDQQIKLLHSRNLISHTNENEFKKLDSKIRFKATELYWTKYFSVPHYDVLQ